MILLVYHCDDGVNQWHDVKYFNEDISTDLSEIAKQIVLNPRNSTTSYEIYKAELLNTVSKREKTEEIH